MTNIFQNYSKLNLTKKIMVLFVPLSIISIFYLLNYTNSVPSDSPTIPFIPTPSSIRNQEFSQLVQTKITFSSNLNFPEIPFTLPYHSVTNLPNQNPSLTQSLITKLNAQAIPSAPNRWSTQNPTGTLYFYQGGVHEYKVDYDKHTSYFIGNNRTPVATAVKTATTFINSIPGFANLKPDQNNVIFETSDIDHTDKGTLKNYDIVTIKFYPFIQNYPVILANNTLPVALVKIGQSNQMISFSINSQSFVLGPETSTSKIKTIDELKTELSSGKFFIVEATYVTSEQLKNKNLPPITIDQLKIEYRLSSNNQSVSPHLTAVGIIDYPNLPTKITLTTSLFQP